MASPCDGLLVNIRAADGGIGGASGRVTAGGTVSTGSKGGRVWLAAYPAQMRIERQPVGGVVVDEKAVGWIGCLARQQLLEIEAL